MVIASTLLGSTFAVVGQNANPGFLNAVDATVQIAAATIETLALDISVTPDMVDNRSEHAGDRFGVPTHETIKAIQLLARTEGIILDPVFSGKGMAGLISDIRDGMLTDADVVVFVHTGGVPAIFSHAQEFTDGNDRRSLISKELPN
jgi:1-aminocyclopropane-1-carboxylate deaminase/D-cysteine desulfhydrase-like pyridoxal-dependent ACC family enzyme